MDRDYKKDFPILNNLINDKELIYLDSAATSQKPISVINTVDNYYKQINANPHRGAYQLSINATEVYDGTRNKVRKFINADSSKEIIFTKNATEAFNLLASSYGMSFIEAGDEVVISIMEHHSNLIPWQRVCKAKGAILKFMYIGEDGIISETEYKTKITEKTKLVAVTHISNVLGTINPVKEIAEYAHTKGAVMIVDGTQSIPHRKIDVKDLDVDFFVFSGHKMLAPMGVGVLYGKEKLLLEMPPYLLGGDMVEYVYEQESTFAALPEKFEGGTQNVEAVIGLGAAIDYMNEIGYEVLQNIERDLTSYALQRLGELNFITVYGTKDLNLKSGVISFNVEGVHPHDVASIIDTYGVSIRVGNHCAQPLLRFLGINSTCRISFYLYNSKDDIDKFIESIKNVRRWLGYGA